MKKTKIIATVGPSCADPKILKSLIRLGVNVFRINASHTTPESLRHWIRHLRKVTHEADSAIPILVDLQGPRVRTGRLEGGKPVVLKKDAIISIIPSSKPGSAEEITTICRPFLKMVKTGDPVLFDNGMIELKVTAVKKGKVICRVVSGGVLGENKGINLPSAPVTLPALSPKDRRDLAIAAGLGADYVALSFVRSAKDIMIVKDWLKKRGKKIPVIAKIEKPKAVDLYESILKVADGIMVARGDLGIELGVEKVPAIQKQLIEQANRRHLPVITATQMLESMIEHPHPTRAEASDVANAVFDGTDAVMLSGETSIGKYPEETIAVMSKIVIDAENNVGESHADSFLKGAEKDQDIAIHAITHAARHAAKDVKAKAVIVFTLTGKTAVFLSKFRPMPPIVAVVPSEKISRQLGLIRDVFPVQMHYQKSALAMLRQTEKKALQLGFLKAGDMVVLLSGRFALPETRFMAKVHRLGRDL